MNLPRIKPISLGGDFELDVDAYLQKSYDDIGEAAVELPAIIEWVNEQLQWIVESKGTKKQELKTAQAKVFVKIKSGHVPNDFSGKLTDKAIEYMIDLDPDVIRINEELSAFLGWSSRLSNLLYVLQAKLDLTRSTESTRRKLVTGNNDDE